MKHPSGFEYGICCLLLTFLVACTPVLATINTATPAFPISVTNTPPPPSATVPTIAPPEENSTPTPEFQLCSPLDGISLIELAQIISKPFEKPVISLDDGHHGVDFAFYQFKQFTTMEGLPIRAMLPGRVAAVDIDRPPYGNMIIIETSLDKIPVQFLNATLFPTPAPTAVNDGRLTCPASGPSPTYNPANRSLYVLSAHMKEPPGLQVGDEVTLCQEIGLVGSTGESSQNHLHLEMRVGPSEARFTSIAHRDTSATEEEMYNYCIWRISNIFQQFDPMELISLQLSFRP